MITRKETSASGFDIFMGFHRPEGQAIHPLAIEQGEQYT